jgi:ribose transport system substrate-binding protein
MGWREKGSMDRSVRIVGFLAIAATLAAAVACGQSSGGAGGAQSKGTIAFLLSGPDLYYQYGLQGAQAAAKRLGYDIKVYPNPNISPSVELANVENAVAAHVVAIDGYSVGLSTETASISRAADANIPIFLMYGYSPQYLHAKGVIGFEQVNLIDYGKPDGTYLGQHLPGGAQVAVITGQLGRGDAEGYRTGFLQGLGCQGNTTAGDPPMTCANGIDYVSTETGHWLRPQAYTAAQDIIGKYPNLAGMFVENEDMAVGVHTALVAAHKDKQVTMVSANGAPYGLDGIRAGWLASSDTASPSLEGLYSVRLIDAYLNHKISGGHLYYSHTVFVTKQNVDQAVGWTFFKDPAQVDKWMSSPLLQPVANPPS